MWEELILAEQEAAVIVRPPVRRVARGHVAEPVGPLGVVLRPALDAPRGKREPPPFVIELERRDSDYGEHLEQALRTHPCNAHGEGAAPRGGQRAAGGLPRLEAQLLHVEQAGGDIAAPHVATPREASSQYCS